MIFSEKKRFDERSTKVLRRNLRGTPSARWHTCFDASPAPGRQFLRLPRVAATDAVEAHPFATWRGNPALPEIWEFHEVRRSFRPTVRGVPEAAIGDDHVSLHLLHDPDRFISKGLAEALIALARCHKCDARANADLSPCKCLSLELHTSEGATGWELTILVVDHDVWDQTIETLWRKDQDAYKKQLRKDRLAHANDVFQVVAHTQRDLGLLQELQDNACYYCGTSIKDGAHVDHLVSVVGGGHDGIDNIMLTCAACNAAKRGGDEDSFWKHLRKTLPPNLYTARREAAKAMKRAKRKWQSEQAIAQRPPID